MLSGVVVVLLLPAAARADRDFAIRYTDNDAGSITFAANTLMTCPGPPGPANPPTTCDAARAGTHGPGETLGNNNGHFMSYVDADGPGPPGTFNSSSADLTLPAGAFVKWAGLYWAGDTAAGSREPATRTVPEIPAGAAAPSPTLRNTVSLRLPGATAYEPVTAQPPPGATQPAPDANGTRFSAFADVTERVRTAGEGTYTVANVQSGTGADRYAAWSLIVVYRDVDEPPRNLTVFDGLETVSRATPTASASLSGFLTPPFGPVRSTVGLWSSEGDRTSTGDSATLNSTPISDATNPADNVFNSSITRLGINVTDKNPNYVNQLGADMNSFPMDRVLSNGAKSATIRLTTGGETYFPAAIFFTTDIFAPDIRPLKSVVDLNGGATERGDELEYTVRLTNIGQDPAVALWFYDPIPAQTAYVPNSLAVTPVPTTGGACGAFVQQSDTAGDGLAEFDPAAGRTVFRLGTGAANTIGGRLDPRQTTCARFRVQVAADAPRTSEIVNQGHAAFVGLTLGTQYPEELSNPVTNVVAGADLVPTKAHAGGAFVGGQAYDFTIGVANQGDLPTTGTVTVEDVFDPAQFSSVNTAGGPGWACTVAGATVTCTRSDPLPAGQPYPPVTVNATVADPAPATVINTATVSGGGDTDDSNNAATDAGGATAQADLAITKGADQAVVPARGEATFTLDVVNRGPSTATAAQVTDTLAPNFEALEVTSSRGTCTVAVVCTLGALAPGQGATITIRARVLDAAVDSIVTNVATVTDTGVSDDPSPDNDSAAAEIDVPVSSDLQVDKSFAPTPNPTAGDLVTYTVTVTNTGPSTANNVITRDVLPDEFYAPAPVPTGTFTGGGTCEWLPEPRNMRCAIDSLAPGQTETITITARLAPDSRGKTVLNSIGAISDSVDPVPALAQDTVSLVPIPAADLELTKVGPPDPVTPGSVGRYTLQFANRGPSGAPDVIVRDTLPDGLTFVGDTAGACSAVGQALTCSLGALNVGGAGELGVDVRVDPSLAGTTVRNAASIASESSDPNIAPAEVIPSSNADADDLVVGPLEPAPPRLAPGPPLFPPPSLDVAVNVRPPASPYTVGEPGRWRVAVVNNGPSTASAVELELARRGAQVDDLGVARPAQAGCRVGAAACALGKLARGERRTLEVRLRPLEAQRLTLAAEVRPAETDAVPPNNTDEASIDPRLAVVAVAVDASSRRVDPGEVISVVTTIKTRKRRPAWATRVCVRIPDGLAVVHPGGARLRDGRACWRIRRIAGNRSRRLRLQLRAVGRDRPRRVTLTGIVTGPYVRDSRAQVSVLVLPAQAPPVTG
jgi:uncharacterized repeat protein (TIGR01451 family)